MYAALAIAGKDLRQRFRDRSALVLGFAAPLLIAAVMNIAFGSSADFHATLGVVDADRGDVASEVVAVLRSPDLANVVTVEELSDVEAAADAVEAGDVDAAVVIPAGFSAGVTASNPVDLEVLTSVDAQLAGEVARSIASSFTAQLTATRLAVAAAIDGGAPPADAARIAADAGSMEPPYDVVDQPPGGRELKGIAYYGPGMAMFFVLFAIGFAVRGFFLERRDGTLDRIAAAPVRPAVILAGKAVSVFVYSLASLLTVSIVAGAVFGASWGHPAAVVVLCVAMSIAVVALAALVMGVARTERQADAISSMLTFTFALLGGSFVYLGVAPDVMRRLSSFTPNGLALRGFTDLATGTPTGDALREPLIGLAIFALAVGTVAALLGRKAVIR